MTDLIDEFQKFIDTYFLTDGYNPVNTITYSVFLVIGVISIYKLIINFNSIAERKWGENYIPIYPDIGFFISISPYILLGGAIRAFNDAFLVPPNPLLSEPWIFGVLTVYTMIIGFFTIITSFKINKDYRILFCIIGIFSTMFFLIPLLLLETSKGTAGIQNWVGMLLTIFLLLSMVVIFHTIKKKQSIITILSLIAFSTILIITSFIFIEKTVIDHLDVFIDTILIILIVIIYTSALFFYEKQSLSDSPNFMANENLLTISGQMWDTIATFISISFFGYSEQNLFPELLIKDLGFWSFFTAKIIVVSSVLILLDRWWEEEEQRNWIKWLFYVLGLATGTRNFLRLITLT
ncbi:MAG: DUF63 family protein [Candidatus Hodarchaeales archaeon]